jgi:hypothetical protein
LLAAKHQRKGCQQKVIDHFFLNQVQNLIFDESIFHIQKIFIVIECILCFDGSFIKVELDVFNRFVKNLFTALVLIQPVRWQSPAGMAYFNAGIYPCVETATTRYPSPERAAYYTVPLELRFGGILFCAGINPCVINIPFLRDYPDATFYR